MSDETTRSIDSPTELEPKGFIQIRGRILGNARLSKKAGIVAIGILALLVLGILYGVTLNEPHIAAITQRYGKPLPVPQTQSWWQNQSDVATAVMHPPEAPNSNASALPSGVPDLTQFATSPPAAVPGSSHVSIDTNALNMTNPTANMPTIPIPAAQTLGAVTARREPSAVLQAMIRPAGEKDALLRAAMVSTFVVEGEPNLNATAYAVGSDSFAAEATHAPEKSPHPFAQEVLSSPFELKAGTVIPAALITAIDSDLPGLLSAQVRQNVYDSVSGRWLLIPQGTKVIGRYDSQVAYGQERILVTWTRLIYPDGSSIDLRGMAGADLVGRSGFDTQVNNHTRKIFQGALLLSVIAAGAQLSQPQQPTTIGSAPGVGQVIAGALGSQIASAGEQIAQRQLNVPPNLRVPAGYEFDVIVDRDIVFPSRY